MTKASQNPKSTERATKKARVEPSSKISRSRTKDSSRAPLKPKITATDASEEKETATPLISEKSKGKQKDTSGKGSTLKRKLREPEEHVLPSTFKVVAGSYEKLLYGLEGTTTVGDDSKLEYHLKPLFIFPAHVSCIKAVAASPDGGKWLATGSADEIVKVWDLRRRKEIGGLMHHQGSITHLVFPSRSHLLSASEDGSLCLFRARDWAVLRALKGHKGRVNSMAVHPSGKVVLSVGKDRALRMWDLMRGKGVASTKLGKEGEIVRWSTDGSLFVVQSGSTIDVYNTEMVLIHAIHHPSRLHDVKFVKRVNGEGELLLAGAEDKKLSIYEISKDVESIPKIIGAMVGHSNRVKAIQTLNIALPAACGKTSTTIVCTASSDGNIHIYDLGALPANSDTLVEIPPAATYDSKGTRLTCVTLAEGDGAGLDAANGKRKRNEQDEEGADAEKDEDGSDDDQEEEFGFGEEEGEEEGEEDEEEGEREGEGEEESD